MTKYRINLRNSEDSAGIGVWVHLDFTDEASRDRVFAVMKAEGLHVMRSWIRNGIEGLESDDL